MNIPFQASPNFWSGDISRVKAIVFHHTAGAYQSAVNWLTNPTSQVSAHVVFARDGRMKQLVQFKDSAWHCGISFNDSSVIAFKSRAAQIVRDNWGTNPNRYTIGFEIEGTGEPFTDAIYNNLADVTRELCAMCNLPVDRYHLIGHYEISPGKPTDPTEMDWDRLISFIKGIPMPTFDYSLYIKDNNLYMKVLSGSIADNITIKNEGTGWVGTPFCSKSVGNDGNYINEAMTPNLYTVTAKGVVHTFDNRPVTPTIDPKDAKIEQLTKDLNNANLTISDLNTKVAQNEASLLDLAKQVDALNIQITDKDATIVILRESAGVGALEKLWVIIKKALHL